MKLERISDNKIKFSISVEELEQKGLFEQDQWRDSYMWHDLFEDMLDEVQGKFGIETQMEITVEIESFDDQEICMILTLESDDDFSDWEEGTEMMKSMNDYDVLVYFDDFDDLIALLKRIDEMGKVNNALIQCSIFYYENNYYILIENLLEGDSFILEAICAEYGQHSTVTKYILMEYGRTVLLRDSIEKILFYF
ncbi:adaptor protein MecA [Rossellomorea aquimaris]|uniref:adaptor protein MecA n=1 Tax=Rossellomorea TaxID=2837508 RepID=UPI001CD262F5|nr:adaptor protein MecA [Rossellomorea aquimaris]MCA1058299.1 adaptor protein MecA [Rossellomorea aquimaris]